MLYRFAVRCAQRDLASISPEEVLEFLLSLTKNNKQATNRNRHSVLASFYNFSINTGSPALINPGNSSVIRKIFKRSQATQRNIFDNETVDEIICRAAETVYVSRKT